MSLIQHQQRLRLNQLITARAECMPKLRSFINQSSYYLLSYIFKKFVKST
jgi:hypothetical protein